MKKRTSGIRPALSGQKIDAMTPPKRRKLLEDIERSTPQGRRAESLPLSAAEHVRMIRAGRGLRTRGHPRLGKGTRVVSVSVEIELLKAADAYAASHGLKRAQLFTQGLRKVLAA